MTQPSLLKKRGLNGFKVRRVKSVAPWCVGRVVRRCHLSALPGVSAGWCGGVTSQLSPHCAKKLNNNDKGDVERAIEKRKRLTCPSKQRMLKRR